MTINTKLMFFKKIFEQGFRSKYNKSYNSL